MSTRYSDETLQQAAEAYAVAGTKAGAARALGLPVTTFKDRLAAAAQAGFTPDFEGEVPPGFMVERATVHFRGGEEVERWTKLKAEQHLHELIAALESRFEQYAGTAFIPPNLQPENDADLLTIYPLADLHLGMYAWSAETGNDFDVEIARKLVKDTVAQLVTISPASSTALVLNLGDFFHADSVENRTRRSGNILDVDTRWARVLEIGVEIMIDLIALALTKHETVIVKNLQGNHDEHSALALGLALKAYYRDCKRVTVDTNPGPFFWMRHGNVLIGATHGDKAKPASMVGIMAAKRAQDWGETSHRYVYLGHVHQKNLGGGELYGAEWETFQTIAPKDNWANSMGFVSGRSMQSITHHKDTGEYIRLTVNVKGPE